MTTPFPEAIHYKVYALLTIDLLQVLSTQLRDKCTLTILYKNGYSETYTIPYNKGMQIYEDLLFALKQVSSIALEELVKGLPR